jgi:glycogen operon protein
VTYRFKAPDGEADLKDGDRGVRLRIDGSAVGDHDFLLLINMDSHAHRFAIPLVGGKRWVRIIDTAAWAEVDCNIWPRDPAHIVGDYEVHPFAIAVLEEWPA